MLQTVLCPLAEERLLSEQGRGCSAVRATGTGQGKSHPWGRRSPQGSSTHPGRVGLVELVEHDDGGAAVVVHQPPEVGGGVLQRVQGDDEGSALGVALRRGKMSTSKDTVVTLEPLLSHPKKPVQPDEWDQTPLLHARAELVSLAQPRSLRALVMGRSK